jgi:bifunctional non-homologous end joining protein LigD
MPPRGLKEYWKKRDPARTPEPFDEGQGAFAATTDGRHLFVIQQHDATRMHWDVRLEMDGVLVSFAVPRGPHLDGTVKRLAMQTEDHPVEYAHFEGTIPEGNYGAGPMLLWDRGAYRTVDGLPPSKHLADGKMDLVFEGLKIKGRWALVRIKDKDKGAEGKAWLFFHKPGRGIVPSLPDLTATHPASIVSGLTIDEIARGADRTEELTRRAREAGAVERPVDPASLTPMLAESGERPFSREGWAFEIKCDGVRALCEKQHVGPVRIFTRQGRDATASFPEVARALVHLPLSSFVIDSEIVALDARGASDFERLQQRLGLTDPSKLARAMVECPAYLFAFDLVSVCGFDTRDLSLSQRKELLQSFMPKLGVTRYQDHVEHEGEALFDRIRALGLEGMMAKRMASRYQAGRRSPDWLKIKPERSADFVVVGLKPGKGNPRDVGSLLLAWRDGNGLVFAGKAGSGLGENARAALAPLMQSGRTAGPAFSWRGLEPEKDTTYVEPRWVAEVRYSGLTRAGLLRHPVFVRLRDDKGPEDCHAPRELMTPPEPAAKVEAPRVSLKLTNLDKTYFPADGYTKGDLLHYYEEVWPWLQPHLKDRPVVLTRYPDGISGKNFYQKNAPPFTPDWVETVRIDDTDYFICNTREALLYVVNSGAIPLHVWHSRRPSLDMPDWSVVDLDPKGAPFVHVVQIAQHIHGMLEAAGTPHFVKTSGQAGLHILLPLDGTLNHTQSRMLAEAIARTVVKELPDISTVERPLHARGGRVYVDFGQNGFGRLIAGVFSARPKDGAPVSTPLSWDEVLGGLTPSAFTIKTVLNKLRAGGDPSRMVLSTKTDVLGLLTRLAQRVA